MIDIITMSRDCARLPSINSGSFQNELAQGETMTKKSMVLCLALSMTMISGLVACEKKAAESEPNTTAEKAQSAEKQAAAKPEKAAEPAEEQAAAATPDASNAVRAQVKDAISAYNKIQTQLVNDSTEGLSAHAAEVQKAASAAQQEASGTLEPQLEKLAEQAEQFQTLAADADIEKVRLAFGEMSKALVGVLSELPAMQQDLHVFECPMAAGYQKWVQLDEELANPYMGQKMAACGSTSEWKM
jgi:hypothetical protein